MKNPLTANVYTKAVIGALILTLLHGLTNLTFDQKEEFDPYVWGVLSNFLVALILGYYIVHSSYVRFKLMAAVFLIYFLIGHFNLLIEAYIFNVTDRVQSAFEILRGFLVTLVFCPIYVYLFKDKVKSSPMKLKGRTFLGLVLENTGSRYFVLVFLSFGRFQSNCTLSPDHAVLRRKNSPVRFDDFNAIVFEGIYIHGNCPSHVAVPKPFQVQESHFNWFGLCGYWWYRTFDPTE